MIPAAVMIPAESHTPKNKEKNKQITEREILSIFRKWIFQEISKADFFHF